jgi:hypothetical protein
MTPEDDYRSLPMGQFMSYVKKATGHMTPEQILKNVQSKIGDYIDGITDPAADVMVEYAGFLEWIDREISKAIEERE